MRRRLIYLSSLTLTVVVNLTLASAHRGEGGSVGGGEERHVKIWREKMGEGRGGELVGRERECPTLTRENRDNN